MACRLWAEEIKKLEERFEKKYVKPYTEEILTCWESLDKLRSQLLMTQKELESLRASLEQRPSDTSTSMSVAASDADTQAVS